MRQRYFIDVEYKGTPYRGWQRQPTTKETVQEYVENALEIVLKKPLEVYGAGRTDAGVHARQLPAHFEWNKDLHESFRFAMNALLPDTIAITRVYKAENEMVHARFSAIHREYKYHVIFRKSALLQDLAWNCRWHPDFDLMQEAASRFLEFDDFESFCKARANNRTHICKLTDSYWEKQGDMWVYTVGANRFLRGMVRTLVGTMVEIGRGKMSLEDIPAIIAAKDRKAAGPAAPPDGLYLTQVKYPDSDLIPVYQK